MDAKEYLIVQRNKEEEDSNGLRQSLLLPQKTAHQGFVLEREGEQQQYA